MPRLDLGRQVSTTEDEDEEVVHNQIYDEVATLISANEHNPRYLLRLFKQLQVCGLLFCYVIIVIIVVIIIIIIIIILAASRQRASAVEGTRRPATHTAEESGADGQSLLQPEYR